jgi:hypothetical protein
MKRGATPEDTYYYHKWGDLMVRIFVSLPKVKGSNLMGDVVCGPFWLNRETDAFLLDHP